MRGSLQRGVVSFSAIFPIGCQRLNMCTAYNDTPDTDILIRNYPELQLLCWNRTDQRISREDAFSLYESQWHFIAHDHMTPDESALVQALAKQFGKGLINA